MRSIGELVDAGVDWLTVTALQNSKREMLGFQAALLMHEERKRGNEMRPWRGMGYQGFSCGQVQFGERQDSSIARLSGEVSRTSYKPFLKHADSVTRIDLQFTQFVGPSPAQTILKYYRAAKRNVRRREYGPTVQLFSASDGSATLYVGKRTSEVMTRCYNKEAESGLDHYKGCLRHEGEFKGDRAIQVAEKIQATEDDAKFAETVVREALSVRSVYPAIVQAGAGGFGVSGSTMLLPTLGPLRSKPTDVFRSLEWLETSVAATVHRLVDQGYADEVLIALGLSIFNERLIRSRDQT